MISLFPHKKVEKDGEELKAAHWEERNISSKPEGRQIKAASFESRKEI